MLIEQTIEKLTSLRLSGMVKALRQWMDTRSTDQLAPDELIGVLADAEWVHRENGKLSSRLRNARFRFKDACVENIIYRPGRGITKQGINQLVSSRWVASHKTLILTGATGGGKSWLACALGQKACRDGYSVLYKRSPLLLEEMAQARADGTYTLLLRRLTRADVLILDDFCMQPLTATARSDLFEVLEDRYGNAATIIASQREPDQWHTAIADATFSDSICDRLVHGAHRIKLGGESIRKVLANQENGACLTEETPSEQ